LVLSAIFLILFAGMAIIGGAHQTIWAFRSGEELFADSSALGLRAMLLQQSIRNHAINNDLDIPNTIAGFEEWRLERSASGPEKYRVSYIPGRDGKLAGIIVLRHPAGPWDGRREFLVVDLRLQKEGFAGNESLQEVVRQLSEWSDGK
jgi:hypothetical protein